MCITLVFSPPRRTPATNCIWQPVLLVTTTSAPVAAMSSIFASSTALAVSVCTML